jgi:methionyl-tRNA synthetase
MSSQKHLITAALPYANGPLHIGHVAGAFLPADIYVRFLRQKNEKVAFICGSDEHGAAITLRAKKEGKTPQEIVDTYHQINKKAFEDFGISFDIYHRTSAEDHHKAAQEFFLKLEENGSFTKEDSQQFYDEDYQQFLADRYITGTCPKCGFEGAYGDQCEKCGSSLNPSDLINPISTLSGKSPILKETSHWYLPMQHHETWLKEWIEKGLLDGKKHHDPKKWRKHVIGQCKSWIDGGLNPRAMTRDLDWGVKVPVENAEGKVLYVWLDAPIGYISATKKWAKENKEDWREYWQNDNTKLVHFIGKDNIVFHCIIFPILLKEHGAYNLPINVPANEFLNLEGKKISTSRNWAIWLHEYLEDFKGKEDVLRYVLCSIAPENKDSEFTWSDFQARNNNELVAILGNFINRVVVLSNKYYKGVVPSVDSFSEDHREIEQLLQKTAGNLNEKLENFQFRDALSEAMNIARIGNKYLADREPWKLIKTDEKKVEEIIFLSLQIAANLTIALQAFMPGTTAKLRNMLSLDEKGWEQLGQLELLPAGSQINKAELLFEKIEDEDIQQQKDKLMSTVTGDEASTPSVSPIKSTIDFEDFQKIDLRVGTVINAEKIAKSNKLLKLEVDLGNEKRTVLSGIAKHYSPEEIKGRQVQLIVNLAPRKMMGIESQGMILMAEDEDGNLSLLGPDKKTSSGSTIS